MYTSEHEIKTMIDTSSTALYLNVTGTKQLRFKIYNKRGYISFFKCRLTI